jgi:glutamine amidotransferase
MIKIIDYGVGNLGSIKNVIKRVGGDSAITSIKNEILEADKLILPGVGSFDYGMNKLISLDLIDVLKYKVIDQKTPILGICLGMQLMTKSSEEGNLKGLGWFDAKVVKFKRNNLSDKIPHMGWNTIDIKKKNSLLINISNLERRFYFVHSYYVSSENKDNILSTTNYINNFVSSIEKDNIYGVQFHPEKSHKFGMELISNFINI